MIKSGHMTKPTVRPTLWASLLVLLFGVVLFGLGTDGYRAFTTEAARVMKLNEQQPAFPADVVMEDDEGRSYSIAEFEGKYVFMTFIYTSCGTFCSQLVMNLAEVYEKLPDSYVREDIVFLSVSFDPERDTVERLAQHKGYFRPGEGDGDTSGDGEGGKDSEESKGSKDSKDSKDSEGRADSWRMVRIADKDQLKRLLETFGVVVIPDGKGNFMHNGAFYLADRTGRLIEVMDFSLVDEAAARLEGLIERDKGT